MANTSETGGYLTPTPLALNLTQFLQTVFVGLSGFNGKLVRPKWQAKPPVQPDANVNWMAFGVSAQIADANAFVGMDSNDVTALQRSEYLEVQCSIYGPDSVENVATIRDGFQISQNLAALRAAKMGFIESGSAIRTAELVNGQWVDRVEIQFKLVRQILRVYPILPFISAGGKIQTVLADGKNTIDWLVEP